LFGYLRLVLIAVPLVADKVQDWIPKTLLVVSELEDAACLVDATFIVDPTSNAMPSLGIVVVSGGGSVIIVVVSSVVA
jgi:hypothetical protein